MNTHIYTIYNVNGENINKNFSSKEQAIGFWKGLRIFGNWITEITEQTVTYPVINGKVETFDLII